MNQKPRNSLGILLVLLAFFVPACSTFAPDPVPSAGACPNEQACDSVSVVDGKCVYEPAGCAEGPDDTASASSAFTAGSWTAVQETRTDPDTGNAVVCGDGSAPYYAVNPSPSGDTRTFFYGFGEGVCWSPTTGNLGVCPPGAGSPATLHFNATDIATLTGAGGQLSLGVLDRTDATNPFKDFNYFVGGLCTGDGGFGKKTAIYAIATGSPPHTNNYTVYHRGHQLVQAYIQDAVATFPSPTQFVAWGFSSAGFAFASHADALVAATPAPDGGTIDRLFIDDAGPFFQTKYLTTALQQTLLTAWNGQLPSGCTACTPVTGSPTTGLHNLFAYNAGLGTIRQAFVEALGDSTISRVLSQSPGNTNLICAANAPYNGCTTGTYPSCSVTGPNCQAGTYPASGVTWPATKDFVLTWLSAGGYAHGYLDGEATGNQWLKHGLGEGHALSIVNQGSCALASWLTAQRDNVAQTSPCTDDVTP